VNIHTEALPLFDGANSLEPITDSRPRGLWLTGEQTKAQALTAHAENRASDIQKVRVAMLAGAAMARSSTLTADDAAIVAERLGIPTGAWLGALFRHWPAVEHTGRYVKSTIPRSRARMVSVWAIKG